MINSIIKILVLLVSVVILCCADQEKELIEKGDELVLKIENFKTENGFLPSDLEDLGIEETLEGPLFYEKVDSVNYVVWFGTTLGESMIYYSDTQEWDYRLRGIGK